MTKLKFLFISLSLSSIALPILAAVTDVATVNDGATRLSTGTPAYVLSVVVIALTCVVYGLFKHIIKMNDLSHKESTDLLRQTIAVLTGVEKAMEKCKGKDC